MAGEIRRIVHLTVNEQLHAALRVVGKAQHGGGAGGAVQQLPQQLLRREAQAGGVDLGAEVLGVERLVRHHAQQIELGFLPVAQKQVLAHADTQRAPHLGAQLHVEGGIVADAGVFDAQPVQQIEGRRLLGQQLTIGTAVVINRGEVHSASPRFRSISPAR